LGIFNFVLEIVCTFLMAMSVIFIVIELRARFDKSFLIFGITNLLLSFFCAIDIWIQPGAQTLFWTRIQHIIASFFPALILWYLMVLLRKMNEKFIRLLFFIGICFSVLFLTNVMLRPSEKEIASTAVYNFSFAPYMMAAIFFIVIFLVRQLYNVSGKEKKVLFFHVIGGSALSCGGILDMINLFIGYRVFPQVPTCTTPGLLLYGLIVTYVFIDRLTNIIRTREITFSKLQDAYKELEEVQTLKELGQSTAIINHEIKNYTFVISGNAQYLYDNVDLSEKHKRIVASIVDTAVKMSEFSKEILNFSKARILSDKRKLAIFSLIANCIQEHFPHKQDSVSIENNVDDLYVHGDWQKLEHVFVNIFKNSFEADATKISIKALRRDTILLLVVEDDGIGCTEEQMGSLFKSFYTTKKGKGGTGLGMCVIRSIIESHGGYISAYSKNILNNDSHGLVLNIAFPIYRETPQDIDGKKDPVVLIKEGIENLSFIIRIFQNVLITPYIVHKAEEIDLKKMPFEKTAVYASANSLDQFKKKFGKWGQTHALVYGNKNAVFVVNETKDKSLQAFSEKYILENLK
jgi:signal transduction histidine kinase